MTCSSVTLLACSRPGSTWTCNCRLRWPQTDTLATPGTPTNRGTMFHCAWTDISISETVFELRPIFKMRLAVDTGWSSSGGLETFGKACAWVRRSCTICRACMRLVPGAKNISIDDRPVMDSDSIDCSQGTPFSRSASNGTVMSDSTSDEDSPSASVLTWRESGENSGTMSSGTPRSCQTPEASRTAAKATTITRRRRLEEMIQCIMGHAPPGAGSSWRRVVRVPFHRWDGAWRSPPRRRHFGRSRAPNRAAGASRPSYLSQRYLHQQLI